MVSNRIRAIAAVMMALWAGPRLAGSGLAGPGLAATAPPLPVAVPAPHERVLPLQGGQNFRDLGGYRTQDGHHVKWGLLFRSGSMHGLTAADYTYLEGRGIRVVCDLRDNRERAAQPVNWPTEHAPTVLSDDYALDTADMMPHGSPDSWTEADARAAFAASYPRMLASFNGQYRRMFAELLAGHAPLAFNCSAGKDRTGIAAALILTALGVPRATVIEDYTATNRYLDTARLMGRGAAPANMAGKPEAAKAAPAMQLGRMKPGVLQALMSADPGYIEAALAVVDQHRDGAAGYLRDELGLGRPEIARLRRMYLE
jgi:protein-tyrosine phosphatase